MIKCKDITEGKYENPCGKDLCCWHCTENDSCMEFCENDNPCPLQIEEPDELQVMEKAVPDKIQEVTDLVIQMKKAEEKIEEIKEALLKAMEEHGIKKFENDKVSFTYVAPSTRNTFDKKKLEKEHPEIKISDYNKVSKVGAFVKIQVK